MIESLARVSTLPYHITNSLYDNVMSARIIAARDLAAMLWMPHVMSRLCMLHVMLVLWMRLLGLRVNATPARICGIRILKFHGYPENSDSEIIQ